MKALSWRLLPILAAAIVAVLSPTTSRAQYTATTFASSGGTVSYDGVGVAVDPSGNVYASGYDTSRAAYVVWMANSTGAPSVAVGGGNYVTCGIASGAVRLGTVGGIGTDPSGNLYVDQSYLLKVQNGTADCVYAQSWSGSGGIVGDAAGNTYVAMGQNQSNVFEVTASGAVQQVAGTRVVNYMQASTQGCFTGTTGPALGAPLGSPIGLALDAAGKNLYIADHYCDVIWKVDLTTKMITIAAGTLYDITILNQPYGVAVDATSNIYVTDTGDNTVREKSGGVMTTIADPSNGLTGPQSIAVAWNGTVYIGDLNGGRASIKQLTPPATQLLSPPPPGPLSGNTVTFTWKPGPAGSTYQLLVGTSGASNIYPNPPTPCPIAPTTTPTSVTVTCLPADGSAVYVQLETTLSNGQTVIAGPYQYSAFQTIRSFSMNAQTAVLGQTVEVSFTIANPFPSTQPLNWSVSQPIAQVCDPFFRGEVCYWLSFILGSNTVSLAQGASSAPIPVSFQAGLPHGVAVPGTVPITVSVWGADGKVIDSVSATLIVN